MIVMKFGGTSVQDAQTIDRIAAIVRERLQLEIFSSPKFRPTTRQVSGHEFTRAVQPKKNLGFLPDAARLKSYPDTCLAVRSKKVPSKDIHHPVFLRASVPPWWVPLFRSPDHPITGSPDLEWVLP
jgi:hypothetical protein